MLWTVVIVIVYRQALSIMPSEEGPSQKIQRQAPDSATIGDIVDFTEMRMLESADKDQQFFSMQSVRNDVFSIIP